MSKHAKWNRSREHWHRQRDLFFRLKENPRGIIDPVVSEMANYVNNTLETRQLRGLH